MDFKEEAILNPTITFTDATALDVKKSVKKGPNSLCFMALDLQLKLIILTSVFLPQRTWFDMVL